MSGNKVVDGNKIAYDIRAEIARDVEALSSEGVRPGLGVVLVGDDPASRVYVRMKTRACREVGIYTRDVRLPASTGRDRLLEEVEALNRNPDVHGILVQLPLPGELDEREVTEAVRPEKDVDGFHPVNLGRLARGDPRAFRPATPAGVQELLRRIGFDPAGRRAVIVGRSTIVGLPMALLLLQKEAGANATVTVAHSRTGDLAEVTREAELLIVAAGRPEMIRGEMVRRGAVVIDVGVNRVPDRSREKGYRLVGDVAFEEAAPRAARITPVPGGVGPMTIAMLLRNTTLAARRQTASREVGAGTGAGG